MSKSDTVNQMFTCEYCGETWGNTLRGFHRDGECLQRKERSTVKTYATINGLKRDAETAMRLRYHVLQGWVDHSETTAETKCTACGAWVQVETRPAPNGIDIGGPAVAVDCGDTF